MKILLVGSGGREHAIAWKLAQNKNVSKIFVAPGNGGTALENKCENINITDLNELVEFAKENNIAYVVEGSNMSDNGDYRPGLKAIEELKVESPLQKANLYKSEIRELSKILGLKTWDKPSKACLASRFAYGEKITEEKLMMIDKAEDVIISKGYVQSRVRVHGNIARIEILPEQINDFIVNDREEVATLLKKIGFSYVTLDLQGYRTGSMNEILNEI